MIPIGAVVASAAFAAAVSVFGCLPNEGAARPQHMRMTTPVIGPTPVASVRKACGRRTVAGPCARHHALVRPLRAIESVAALGPVLDAAEALGTLSVERSLDCKLTAYGPGFASTGKRPGDPGYGVTATGRVARPRHTIAVDPRTIPLGSLVYIDGVGYRVAEDVGGAIRGHHIDVYFPSDVQARIFGVKRHVKVFVFGRTPKVPQANALRG